MDDPRIEHFRKMAEADPENELGHFSLGKAYLDNQQPADAAGCFRRVIELNPQNSKAYQLLGQAQLASGDRTGAAETLRKGFEVAAARGDMMPKNAIAALLREMGEPVPQAGGGAADAPPPVVGEGQVLCRRCGVSKPALPERPFKGPVGEKVLASVCADCWREWIHMGTKVINEFRLNFANPRHGEIYDQYMREFLNLE